MLSDYKIKNRTSYNLIGKIKIKVLVGCTVAVTSLFSVQLVAANNLATDGEKLSAVEHEITQIEAQNTSLKMEVAKESSLSSLANKAKEMGFAKPSKIITSR